MKPWLSLRHGPDLEKLSRRFRTVYASVERPCGASRTTSSTWKRRAALEYSGLRMIGVRRRTGIRDLLSSRLSDDCEICIGSFANVLQLQREQRSCAT